ncbi:endonuclease/exonuclease/phosphatase family protein [Natronoflexus pectinivorans]|uniref:Exonuclease III n=1 Tax=Natronoflexus pectinivorans TaxID=682526 RepID=A0A4R2GMC3_9BACT|nr:endonuclease/exonuclease/phosphatase family protein [Natronoflexus pectinivorans]TCO09887.1 exonuclease III [Natronoflexus pectinivorans]
MKKLLCVLWNSCFLLFLVLLFGCNRTPVTEVPSMPLIHLEFDNKISNEGVLPVTFRGDENVSFSKDGVSNYSLDLTSAAKFRKPVVIVKGDGQSFNDYPGLSIFFWVKAHPGDPYEYTIISQLADDELAPQGWLFGKTTSGSYRWMLTDGLNEAVYEPTSIRQPIANGEWHLLGYTLDFARKEARVYYNGENVAVFCLQNFNLDIFKGDIYIGGHPFSTNPIRDAFHGLIDEFTIWSRVLTPEQIKTLCGDKSQLTRRRRESRPDSLTIMTWNIWNGGRADGLFAGPQRVAEIIRESGADIISLQEAFDSGEMIADILGFYYYQRSPGLSILSRYPFGRTYNVYRPRHSGAVVVNLPRDNQIVMVPVALSYLPNLGPYIMSGHARSDSVIIREMQSRGSEIRFIMWEMQSIQNSYSDYPIILAGDFNSGSHLDWTEANRESRFDLVIEHPVSKTIEDAGFIDAFRYIYPNEVTNPGFTWSPRYKEVMQDRINFIYYKGPGFNASWSRVIDQFEPGFPSDHAAVVVSFKWDDQ